MKMRSHFFFFYYVLFSFNRNKFVLEHWYIIFCWSHIYIVIFSYSLVFKTLNSIRHFLKKFILKLMVICIFTIRGYFYNIVQNLKKNTIIHSTILVYFYVLFEICFFICISIWTCITIGYYIIRLPSLYLFLYLYLINTYSMMNIQWT